MGLFSFRKSRSLQATVSRDFVVTGGAALPLGILDNDKLDAWQQKLRAGAEDDHFDPTPLIRACLQQGASLYIRYERNGRHGEAKEPKPCPKSPNLAATT